jgi:hypothetical protein
LTATDFFDVRTELLLKGFSDGFRGAGLGIIEHEGLGFGLFLAAGDGCEESRENQNVFHLMVRF